MFTPQSTLAELATQVPAASRVFHRHHLDFCCGGGVSLERACAAGHLDPAALLAEIESERARAADAEPPPTTSAEALIAHILERYHEPLMPEVTRLIGLAKKVEAVHADHPDCPRGLADHLEAMDEALASHLAKEEEVLFPLILQGRGSNAHTPVRVLLHEHDDHGVSLRKTRAICHDFQPPADACNSWRALYLGLDALELDLMEHIHLENNVLFPRILQR
ncbi:MAG: iron-sulfur cluster repair di-iron protein [Myxococcota bacterium]